MTSAQEDSLRNGRSFWRIASAVVTGVAALVTFLYLGDKVGTNSERLATLERRLAEEIPKAVVTHGEIEARFDAKLVQQRELILSELRGINQRLDRIDRKIP